MFFGDNYKILDCTFNTDQTLEEAVELLKNNAEKAVREGNTQLILSDKIYLKQNYRCQCFYVLVQ